MFRGKRKTTMLFVASGLLTGVVILLWGLGSLRSLELSSVDKRFAIRGDLPAKEFKDVAIVAIDNKTFNDLDEQWPFPRSMQGEVIDRLKDAGAKVIAVDIQFTEPSDDVDEDYALADSVGRAGNVVLATTQSRDGKTDVLGGDENVKAFNATVGMSRVPYDPGGVVRRYDYQRDTIDSFAVAAVKRGTGERVAAANFPDRGTMWIDYAGPAGTIPRIDYADVLRGKFDPRAVRGKYVVVGATDDTLHDIHRASTTQAMAGPEIHANAIATILNDFPLQNAGWALTLLLILLFGFAEPLLNTRFTPMGAFLVSLGGGVFYVLVALYVFTLGYILPVTYPLIALVLSMFATLAINFLAAAFERERTRAEFARFAPDSVVDQVLADGGDGAKLGGKRVEATLLFSDLRGFTTFSEKLEPEQVINTLNDYLTEMSEAILDHQGTLVSFMGDGIMAVFGAPVEHADHADLALAAARDMLDRMHGFNARMAAAGLGNGFKMGIGLNTGPVMSGNVGSERRLEYTAIGDTTNTAARLEGATKGTSYQLYISGSTYDALAEKPADFEFIEDMPIRGRDSKLAVWGLVEPDADALPSAPPRPAPAPPEPPAPSPA